MFFGSNLQFLRRQAGLTQEQLAQQMGVSRQTISKWESGQAPELGKLLELSDYLRCALDDLLRQDLSLRRSPVEIHLVKGFSMARYTMISPHAEKDLQNRMEDWTRQNGLENAPYLTWSFPYVSADQKRLGLTGFCGACVLPRGFLPSSQELEITSQGDHPYAVMTFPEPSGRDPRHIARCIQTILEFLRESGISKSAEPGYLPCFEWRYEKNGTPWASLFLQCRNTETAEVFTFETT